MKSDDELKQIATDLHAGKIFSDRHCISLEEVRGVFLILIFMDEAAMKKMREDKIEFIYEYLSEAGPRSVNGKPSFMSLRMLNQDETKKMFEYYEKIKAAVAEAIK